VQTKGLLVLAALGEAATGATLFIVPSLVGELLFSAPLTGIAVVVARLTGIALIGLGVACWPGRNTYRAVFAMLTYSMLATLYLIFLGVTRQVGILLWPAVALHAGIAALLVIMWRKESVSAANHLEPPAGCK
jgi:hypothetical protein